MTCRVGDLEIAGLDPSPGSSARSQSHGPSLVALLLGVRVSVVESI